MYNAARVQFTRVASALVAQMRTYAIRACITANVSRSRFVNVRDRVGANHK